MVGLGRIWRWWRDTIESCRGRSWRHRMWERIDAVVDESGHTFTPYRGQATEPGERIVPGGWDHDHCDICRATICDGPDDHEHAAWTDGDGAWVCDACHAKHLKGLANDAPAGDIAAEK